MYSCLKLLKEFLFSIRPWFTCLCSVVSFASGFVQTFSVEVYLLSKRFWLMKGFDFFGAWVLSFSSSSRTLFLLQLFNFGLNLVSIDPERVDDEDDSFSFKTKTGFLFSSDKIFCFNRSWPWLIPLSYLGREWWEGFLLSLSFWLFSSRLRSLKKGSQFTHPNRETKHPQNWSYKYPRCW